MTVADVVRAHAVDEADEALLLSMLGLAQEPAQAPPPARVRPVIASAVHGRRATYVRGCGCGRCTAANRLYVAAWRSRGGCPVTGRTRLRCVVLEQPQGRGRARVWPGQLALVVPVAAVHRARARRTNQQGGEG